MNMNTYTDLLVKTGNPAHLDSVAQQLFAGALVGGGLPGGYVIDLATGAYLLRVFGNAGFAKFAIPHQGYGEVVGERIYPIPAISCEKCGGHDGMVGPPFLCAECFRVASNQPGAQ